MHREDCAILFKESYLELEITVSQEAVAHALYAEGDHSKKLI